MRTASLVLICLTASSLAPSLVGCGSDSPAVVPGKGKKATGGQAGTSAAGGAGPTAGGGGALGGAGGAAGVSAGGASAGGGPSAGTGGATAGTGGSPVGGSGGGVGAAAGKGGTPSGGAGGAPAPVKKKGVGHVEFFAGKATASTFLNGGSARFVHGPSAGQTPACVVEDLGGVCKVEVCAPTAEMIESSGIIDIQVATVTQLHLAFDEGTKTYGVQETTLPKDKALAKAGDVVTMLASGFDAPSFNADVTFPEALTLSLPAQAGPFLLDTASDLGYQVSGSGTGSVEVVIASVKKDNLLERTTVTCSVPAGAGAGKLPSAALKKLPVADAAKYTTEITVKTVASAPAALLQSYDVTLRAATHALDGKGAPWTKQTVTLM